MSIQVGRPTLALLLLAVFACTDSERGAPSTAALAALTDVIDWMNGSPLDEATYAARFTPEFVRQVPFDSFVMTLEAVRTDPPWSVDQVEQAADDTVEALIRSGDQRLRVSLTVALGRTEPPQIAGLLLQPAKEFVPPADVDEAIARLEDQGRLSWLTATTQAGSCDPLFEREAERVEPVGSTFKLWVLSALIDQVRAGELEWSDDVTVRDELDSLPTGTTQNEPDGSRLSVRELAERMISISDNTAADHLIELVGRERVEQALIDTDHSHPEQNRPFLTTREFFILKLSADSTLRERYIAADEAGKRAILEDEVAAASLPTLAEAGDSIERGPTDIYEVEWFGTMDDLCRVLVRLTADPDARDILAINPGVPAPAGQWSYLGFKGGSEAGVLAVAWAHETSEGEHYTTTAVLSNPDEALNEAEAVQLMASLRDRTPDLTNP